ncbi:hypothetical protein F4679DRAFT_531312 [Xylaria curta]|nr:hypothetical protein F4679DRAFT_531312 [Xylaria curta]
MINESTRSIVRSSEKVAYSTTPSHVLDNPTEREQKEEYDQDDKTDYLRPLELVPGFIAMVLGIFIFGLDNTIVGTATPTITNEFHSFKEPVL